jgi:hypothetical protein
MKPKKSKVEIILPPGVYVGIIDKVKVVGGSVKVDFRVIDTEQNDKTIKTFQYKIT